MTRDEFDSCLEKIKSLFDFDKDFLDTISPELEQLYEWASKPRVNPKGFGLKRTQVPRSIRPQDTVILLIKILAMTSEISLVGLEQEKELGRAIPRLAKERANLLEEARKWRGTVTGGSKGGKKAGKNRRSIRMKFNKEVGSIAQKAFSGNDWSVDYKSVTDKIWIEVQDAIKAEKPWHGIPYQDMLYARIGRTTIYDVVSTH